MSTSDDPRGFRRGQPNNTQHPASDGRRDDPRQPARPDPRGNGARQGYQPRQEENYGSFADSDQNYVERPAAAPRQGASFSAFRPEAYADPAEQQNAGRAENTDWQQEPRQFAPEPRQAMDNRPAARSPQPEPFRPQPAAADRGRAHDPYADVSNDPYDTGRRDFTNDWNDDSFQPQQAAQFAATDYYAPHDDPNPTEVQSVHNRFFAADDEPERAPPQQQAAAPQAPRYRQNDFAAQDYEPEPPREQPRAPKPAPVSPAGNGGFDEGDGYRWDSFEQPPAPEAVRPSFALTKTTGGREDELDADYFADEEEFEGEDDYAEAPRSGSKRLMAAVLVGAVVTGGGLAYFYKAQTGDSAGSEPPIMTADARPVKERPTDPGGREFANGSKLIYDRLADANGGAEEATRVASTEEPGATSRAGGGVVTTGANGTLEERIKNALNNSQRPDEAPSGQSAGRAPQSPDEPRRVQTQIFRPDGSVEASRAQRVQAPADAEPAPARSAARAVAPVTANLAAPSPQPVARTRVAEATPAQASISAGGDAGMFVQIAARNDEAAAKAAYADLKQKYAGVLGDHSPSVRKVDLGDKGVWYRLLVGPMPSKGDADKLCEDLKTAGMKGCFSRKE